jgi:hypothetical protein
VAVEEVEREFDRLRRDLGIVSINDVLPEQALLSENSLAYSCGPTPVWWTVEVLGSGYSI